MLPIDRRCYRVFCVLCLLVLAVGAAPQRARADVAIPTLANPILFVTQVPLPADFTTVNAVFGNQDPEMQSAGRGGDLWIRFPNGMLKNLTQAAGYGVSGFQGATAIAVRDPSVHWNGSKALFSMAIGAPVQQYVWETYYWQIYEVSGLGSGDTPVVTRVPFQPADYNNVSPIYGSDDRILFTSDRPRNGAPHLYPQLDEYEEQATVTGIWRLNPANGDLQLLNHAPSGDFTPLVDSFGRLIFTQWDHLQRDQQADTDALTPPGTPAPYGTFNYADESAGAARLDDRSEVYPEPRSERSDLLAGTNLNGHEFNHFFPWQMNEDGSGLETLNHIGRHELHDYIPASINDDPNVQEYYGQYPRFNPNPIDNMLQIKEDPLHPGRYLGIDAPEFYTHAAGQIVSLNGAPQVDADHMAVTYITHRDTAGYTGNPGPNHSGHYRDPLPLADGTVIAAHTAETDLDHNVGTRAHPASRYDFRLKTIVPAANGYWTAGQALTGGISKTVSYWDPDVLVSYSGPLWELQPAEVRPHPRPAHAASPLPGPELQAFAAAGVDPARLQAYLRSQNLALITSRNVTTRDDADRQQPFNLRIMDGGTQTTGAAGRLYDIGYMQLFQADQVRGLGGTVAPRPGRRVLAQPLHDAAGLNPPLVGAPLSSVALASDGSMAAFVPAQRALSWQLTAPDGSGIVRERYWLTFQPGEVRVCTSCHGLNQTDQAGQGLPQNVPLALTNLLRDWWCPDYNGSGVVDIDDVTAIAQRWAQHSSDPRYDRDGDGEISAVDIMLVAARWQEAC